MRPAVRHALALLLACLLCTVAWADAGARAGTVGLNGKHFRVELATTPAEHQRGLMQRTRLGADEGMLFVFVPPRVVSFWMKDMHLHLDILYFDERAELIDIHRDVPPCRSTPCPRYPSSRPVKYALEVPAGTAERIGARPGDRLQLAP